MLIRAAAWLLLVFAGCLPQSAGVRAAPEERPPIPAAVAVAPPETAPPDTTYDFWPENRNIGECISALPKPGCGSEARGGWAQTAVFGAIVLGIAFIVWRIVVSARRTNGSPSDRQQGAST